MTARASDFPDLIAHMDGNGIIPANAETILLNDRHQRFHILAQGKHTQNGWLRGHVDLDGHGALATYKDWVVGVEHVWHFRDGPQRVDALRPLMRRTAAVVAVAKDAETARYEAIAKQERVAYADMPPAPQDHPYLLSKGLYIPGARLDADGNLALPLYNMACEFRGTQRVAMHARSKVKNGRTVHFFPRWFHGPLLHSYVPIWPAEALHTHQIDVLGVAEGAATAVAAAAYHRVPVAAALSTVNLLNVAMDARAKFPAAHLILFADRDLHVPGNPGMTDAFAAAAAVGGEVVAPPGGFDGDWCDWMQRSARP